MAKMTLRTAPIYCLGIWAAIWLEFLMIRFSSFDIRVIPGIGPVMLTALVAILVAPVVATGIAAAALVRQPVPGIQAVCPKPIRCPVSSYRFAAQVQ